MGVGHTHRPCNSWFFFKKTQIRMKIKVKVLKLELIHESDNILLLLQLLEGAHAELARRDGHGSVLDQGVSAARGVPCVRPSCQSQLPAMTVDSLAKLYWKNSLLTLERLRMIWYESKKNELSVMTLKKPQVRQLTRVVNIVLISTTGRKIEEVMKVWKLRHKKPELCQLTPVVYLVLT